MKLSMRVFFVIFSLFILSLCYCSNPAGPSKPANYVQGNNFIARDAKVRLSVPSDWYLTVDTTIGIYRFPCIGRKNIVSQFIPNFNIYWSNHSGTSNMSLILDTAQMMVLGTFQNSSIVSKQTVQIDSITCGEIVYLTTINGNALEQKQLFIIHNNKDILITFTDLQSNYANSVTDFNSIQSSILLD